jgi:membrane protein DedA with SNARE-associated domain
MNFARFALLTAIGSAVWNIALIGAGAALGDQWDRVGDYVGIFQWVVITALVVAVARFSLLKLRARRSR